MTTRRRTLLFMCALGFSAALLPAGHAAAMPTQDPGVTFGAGDAEATTSDAAATSTTASSQTNQTLVESAEQPDKPLFTESRKVAAVIGGLVMVAFALLLLTIRYWKVTKPVAVRSEAGLPLLPPSLELNDESIFVTDPADLTEGSLTAAAIEAPTSGAVAVVGVPGSDHDAADSDWQPRTGEHQRVEIPTGTTRVRPGVAARRKALGLDPR